MLSAQTQLIEKVGQGDASLVIPYSKYQLDNGLTLIVHEDHSDPVVHIDVTYHVGSAREEIGKSGFAHFFEHMMFQGSENVADEEHFKIVTESGGTLNGTTNRDRTNYFETLPANQLETGLWLEADRMGFLLDAVTQKKFEIQRATVKNERGQNYDNRPYGLAREYAAKTLYPYGHPYSWLTIGYIEDLNRVDVDDLKRFFMRWYGPNNATLTVGGDVKTSDVVKMVEKYFGSIPRGPEVEDMPSMVPSLKKDRYVSYQDEVRFPMLQMVWPTTPLYSQDEAAIDCLADIIGGGQTSLLYKNLVKSQKALQAVAYHPCFELSGEFNVTVLANKGSELPEIKTIVENTLAEFEKRGVTDEDVQKYIAQRESSVIYGLSTVRGKVSQLAQYATFVGDPNYIAKDLERYQNLTKEDVWAAYNKYIRGQSSVVLSVYPEGGENLIAGKDNYKVDDSKYKAGEDEYAGLSYTKPEDNFDRSQKPEAGKNPVVEVPSTWKYKLQNGVPIIGTVSQEIPTVNILITIEGGQLLERNIPNKAGITRLMTDLMNESTEQHSTEEMAKELELLGSSVSVGSSKTAMTINIQSLKKNLQPTLELAYEIMFQPAFKEEDFNRLKTQQIELIENQNTQPTSIASKVYQKILYGEGSILGIPTGGTVETVSNINLADIKQHYSNYFSPSTANIVIVGDANLDQIEPWLEPLGSWEGPQVDIPNEFRVANQGETKIYLVDKEKSAQSQIRIAKYTGLKYDATGEYFKTSLMNYPLGGHFNSRINLNLREDKGYTYGARSRFSGNKYEGNYLAYAGVKLDATSESIEEFMKEIETYFNKGIKEDELEFMKKSIGQREALSYESPFQKAGFLRRLITYDLPSDYTVQQNQILQEMTKEEIDLLAKKYLNPKEFNIVVVGDKAAIKEKLEKLDYPIVEMDKEGNPLIIPGTEKLQKKK